MKRARMMVVIGGLVLTSAACGAHAPRATPPTHTTASAARMSAFGVIKSLTPLTSGYKLRFDLALLLTANRTGLQACIDSRECPPGTSGFLDDLHVHDLRYALTLELASDAAITVYNGDLPVTITGRDLYALSRGSNPRRLQVGTSIHHLWFDITYDDIPSQTRFDPVLHMREIYHP